MTIKVRSRRAAATILWLGQHSWVVPTIYGIVALLLFRMNPLYTLPVVFGGTAQASDYLENLLIDHIFRTRTFAKPTALYYALFTAAPSDSGGGTEVSGGSYARVNLAPLDTNYTATQGGTSGNSTGSGGLTTNAVAITFAAPTGTWGTVGWYAIFDAVSGGNMLIWDALTNARTILSGDPAPSFAIGALQITVS